VGLKQSSVVFIGQQHLLRAVRNVIGSAVVPLLASSLPPHRRPKMNRLRNNPFDALPALRPQSAQMPERCHFDLTAAYPRHPPLPVPFLISKSKKARLCALPVPLLLAVEHWVPICHTIASSGAILARSCCPFLISDLSHT
jgi:hypothetical protein